MKDALVPTPGALGIGRIFSHYIQKRLENTEHQRLAVLGHKQELAVALLSDFVHEFGETPGVREV